MYMGCVRTHDDVIVLVLVRTFKLVRISTRTRTATHTRTHTRTSTRARTSTRTRAPTTETTYHTPPPSVTTFTYAQCASSHLLLMM